MHRYIHPNYSLALALSALCLILSGLALAQSPPQYTENSIDQTMRADFAVDPATLNMSLSIALAERPGRGLDLPVTLNYASKLWRMRFMSTYTLAPPLGNGIYTDTKPLFGEHSVAGWSTTLDVPYVEYSPQFYDTAGWPVCIECEPDPYTYLHLVERVIVHLPGGSNHELRRPNDEPIPYMPGQGTAMSGVYTAVDGSRLKFDASASPPVIYLPDGSRYLLPASGSPQYIDRNGNTLTFNTTTKQWTDTLGRTIGLALNNTAAGTQTITMTGVGGGSMTFKFVWANLAQVLTAGGSTQYRGCYICQPPFNWLSPSLFTTPDWHDRVCGDHSSPTQGIPFNPVVLSEIELPNKRKYTFTYNVFGEIDKVVLPTGGYERYVHGQIPPLDSDLAGTLYGQTNRGVTARYVSVTGQAVDEKLWQYGVTTPTGRYVITTTAPDGTRTERELHKSAGSPGWGFDDARTGRITEERIYTAQNQMWQMWRRTLTEWDKTITSSGYGATRYPRPITRVEILLDTDWNGDGKLDEGDSCLASATRMTYDADLNPTSTSRYAYASLLRSAAQSNLIGSIPQGSLQRKEERTYLLSDPDFSGSWTSYRNRHLLALPTKQFVKNGSGTVVAAAKIAYDERALSTYASVVSWSNPGTTVRGNPTTTQRWLNFNGTSFQDYPYGSWITTKQDYDQCGSVRKVTDANDKEWLTFYNDAFSDGVNQNAYAYPTRVETPIPDTSGVRGSSVSLTTYTTYDFRTGKITKTKDPNNRETLYSYYPGDPVDASYPGRSLNRLQQVTRPDGGQTTYDYRDDPGTGNPGNIWILQKTKQDAAGAWMEDYFYFDRWGRKWRAARKETATQWRAEDTQYDDLGRVWKVSNPYFVTNPAAALTGLSIWTTTSYDALGRVVTVTMPDNAVVSTAHIGNQVTATDQAGRVRRSVSDALGRLTEVVEDPAGLNYSTTYTYGTNGDLIRVNQGGQYRYFLYDSLSRLLRARNPEQNTLGSLALSPPPDQSAGNSAWSLKYVYDPNGNLASRTDARSVTTSYSYDTVNRSYYRSYAGAGDTTPAVSAVFDNCTNGKGRPCSMTDGAGSESWVYDAMGRVTSSTRSTTGGPTLTINYAYNYTGGMTSAAFPGIYDGAYPMTYFYSYDLAGRQKTLRWDNGSSPQQIVSDHTFTFNGTSAQETTVLANTRTETLTYNIRMQPTRRLVSGILDLTAQYVKTGRPSTENDGNVWREQETYEALDRSFDYDKANRILQQTWSGNWINFSTDRWGNKSQSSNVAALNTPLAFNSGNRISTTGYGYDAAGNQTSAPGTTWQYDAENRIKTIGGGTSSYFYDGNGRRVKKVTPGGTRYYYYDVNGVPVWEYTNYWETTNLHFNGKLVFTRTAAGTPYNRWVHSDHLGTPRAKTDDSGALVPNSRLWFHPYGEQANATSDVVKYKFTGKERDNESGLDYFGARYYASTIGRFGTTDPFLGSGRTENPQSWNRYAYALGNPLKYYDPTGMDPVTPISVIQDEERKKRGEAVANQQQEQENQQTGIDESAGMEDQADSASRVLDSVQTGLDIVGLVPVFGEPADIVNAGISALRGNWFEAGLSVFSTVPFVGWGGTLAKVGVRYSDDAAALIKLAKGAKRSGISADEASTLLKWADEYSVTPALDHINTNHWPGGPHIRIGPANHIRVVE